MTHSDTIPPGAPEAERTTDSGVRLMPWQAHVLLLEDEVELRDWYRAVLEGDGHRVTALGDGDAAIAYFAVGLRENQPGSNVDCIVSDLHLPGASGLDLIRFIEERGQFVPAVFVTGFGSYEAWLEAQRLGVSCVLDKPVSARDLIRSVRKVLGTTASSS